MLPGVGEVGVSWACRGGRLDGAPFAHHPSSQHWSRCFEYPWALATGDFRAGQRVLDAAGGTGPLQGVLRGLGCRVLNADLRPPAGGVACDLRHLPFVAGAFDRVACVSVLEHVERPLDAVLELWRVLAPGGRLVMTWDVATHARWNHTVDTAVAVQLLGLFGAAPPPEPAGLLDRWFAEVGPGPGEPGAVLLKVLCLYADRAT